MLALLAFLVHCSPSFAQELRTEVLWPGHPASAFDLARDEARLRKEMTAWSLDDAKDPERGEVTRWAFTMRPGFGFDDIFWRHEIERPFETLSLWVRNAGAPFTLSLKVADKGNAEYTPKPVALPGDGTWRRVDWPWQDFALASWSKDADGAFDWPAPYLAVIAFDVKPEVNYEVFLGEMSVQRPKPPQVIVSGVSLPERAEAGAVVPLRMTVQAQQALPADAVATVRLLRNGAVMAEQPVSAAKPPPEWPVGTNVELATDLRIPRYAWGGPHEVQLRVGFADVVYQDRKDGVIGTVKINQRTPRPVVAKVKMHNGAPTLFIDGKPNSAMVYMTYQPNSKYYRQFGEHGVHIYSFPSTCSRHTWQGFARQAWLAPGDHFDLSQLDQQILKILEADPQAYIFPRVYVNSPDWWDKLHPDQLVLYDDGEGEPKLFHETENKPCPSWASGIWRQDTAYALRMYIDHIRHAPYADRVIGYHIASGTTEEWMYWGANEGKYCDYSQPTVEAFHRWLRARYKTDAALQQAWGQPGVTLAAAAIPRYQKRIATEHGAFRDPVSARDVIDFQLFLSDLTAETINYFAHVVKQETNREALFGAFYGYVLQLFEQRQQNAGHLAPRTVWKCPDVDFLTSPTSYAFRSLAGGFSHFMSLTDSVKLHGKMWFDENDIRTWLTGGRTGEWGKQDTYEGSLAMQQREFANVICNSCGHWWFDMGGGWYDDPRILKDIGQMKVVADETVAWKREPVSQIAFVVDPQSLAYLRSHNGVTDWFLLRQLPQLGRCGAPFGYYDLGDLADMPPQRLYIFANAWAPTEQQRALIDQRVKRDGATALWLYAPGLVRGAKLDEQSMLDLTGIRLRFSEQPAPLKAALAEGSTYGTDQAFAPVVWADDPDAEVLGTLAGSDRAGLVVKRMDGWTSVFSAAPVLPAGLLRKLAREAGVHIYVDSDDTVYANQSLLALFVDQGGPRTIHLPEPATVEDLFTGKVVAEGTTEFQVDTPGETTRLWRLK
jgi:hypothetical protein